MILEKSDIDLTFQQNLYLGFLQTNTEKAEYLILKDNLPLIKTTKIR